jgi:alanine-synthesizing transaminase
LFKLVCEPGDAVLVPRPSYPLLAHLTALEGVRLQTYPLHYAGGWQLDLNRIAEELGPRVRAVVAISPNNPTGNYLTGAELDELARLCSGRAALIVDEVFRDYPFHAGAEGPAASTVDDGLVFGLGGLSKLAGLPQLKLGWIGVSGARGCCEAALERLELIADAYLSVSTPVQLAADQLLTAGNTWRERALARVRENRYLLAQMLRSEAPHCTLLHAAGGWSAIIQLPAVESEESIVERLLCEERVLVQPGFFYDFAGEAHIVVSLLVSTPQLEVGLPRLTRHLRRLR